MGRGVMLMQNKMDYKEAYEELMSAVDQAISILGRAQILTDYRVKFSHGETVAKEELAEAEDVLRMLEETTDRA